MVVTSSWVHGNSAMLQYPGGGGPFPYWTGNPPSQMHHVTDADQTHPWTDSFGLRKGRGATFTGQANQSNWFHFSIPTPPIFSGKQVCLQQVFVLFNADPGVEVDLVMAFDGPNSIGLLMNTPNGLSGRHDGTNGRADLVEGETLFSTEERPAVLWGVGVSVHVSFHVNNGNITFTAAGADFQTISCKEDTEDTGKER